MTAATDGQILDRLEAWENNEGPLPDWLEFYRRLLRVQSEAKSRISVPRLGLSEEDVGNRITSGAPLLGFADLAIDWSLMQDICEEVSALVSSYSAILIEVPANLKDLVSSLDSLKEASRIWFEGAPLPSGIKASGANDDFWEFIIAAALKPFLTSHREAVVSLVNQELWRRRYCPVCGGSPDFAFLDRERGARWLVCSRCDAEWLFQRLECPYCGTQDQDALAHFTDDKGLYRLYVCERCRQYLKTIDLRRAEDEVLLPLERFLTLDIDTQAQKDGYSPNGRTRKVEPSPNHRKRS